MRRASLAVRCIWAACLLFGGANHARTLLQHGLLWGYGGVGWASAAYWSSLTLLDPIVAILLFVRPRIGIVSTFVLIVTNVGHNLVVTARYVPENEFLSRAASDPFLLSQIGFMLFVVATAATAWNGVQKKAGGDAVSRGDDAAPHPTARLK
jgi:hypothetical protein